VKSGESGNLQLSTVAQCVPSGLFNADTTFNLSLIVLPHRFSNVSLTNAGPDLILSLEQNKPLSSRIFELIFPGQAVEAANSGEVEAHLTLSKEALKSVEKLFLMPSIHKRMALNMSLAWNQKLDPANSFEDIKVPLLRPLETKQVKIGHADLSPAIETAPLPLVGGKVWNNGVWEDKTADIKPSGKTLVVIHGMMSTWMMLSNAQKPSSKG